METKTTNDILIRDKSCKDFKDRRLNEKWVRVGSIIKRIDELLIKNDSVPKVLIEAINEPLNILRNELSQSSGECREPESSRNGNSSPDIPVVDNSVLNVDKTDSSTQESLCLCGHTKEEHTFIDREGYYGCMHCYKNISEDISDYCDCMNFRKVE